MNPEPPNARPLNLGDPDRERLHDQSHPRGSPHRSRASVPAADLG